MASKRKRPTAAEEVRALIGAVGGPRALELAEAVAKRPVGRPRTRGTHLHVRVSPAALARWQAAAEAADLTLTDWVTRALDRAAVRRRV